MTAVGLAALLVGGGGAYALASSNAGTITVCVKHNGGTLYKDRKCAKHDKQLRWNELGPRGIQGPQGPRGAQGAQGTNGATNVVVRTATADVASGQDAFDRASCQPGERATGGGVSFPSFDHATTVNVSYPTVNGLPASAGQTPDGWGAGIYNDLATTQTATFYVICVSP